MATMTPGYAVLPVTASLANMTSELRTQLVGPTQKASKQAGDAIRRGMTDGVDKATKDVERANFRIKKSTEEQTAAESKLEEQKLKTKAADDAVKIAARQRAEAETKGIDAIEKAQLNLDKKRAAAIREARNLSKAEGDVEKALTESARAAESLTARQEALDKANKDAEGSSKGFIASLQTMQGEMDDTAEKSSTLGDKIMSGFSKVGTGALLGVGAKIGTTVMGGIGTAFSKGFTRLASLEQAETSLEGLGRPAEDIENIMGSVNQAVSGTAFGLDEASKSAATFSTLGVASGEDMDRVMTLLADTTAQANSSLDEMSPIMNKIVAAGGLNIETFDQLNERATGVGEALSKHLGIPIEEVRDKANEVDFETFAAAMEANIGGAAQTSGETFGNSLGNMQAALGRLGQKFLEPAFKLGPQVFSAIGGAVDKLGEHLGPLISDFSEKLAPHMEDFAERLGPWLEETIDNIANGLKTSVGWVRDNEEWLKALVVGVGAAVGAWKLWTLGMKAHNAAVLIGDKGWKAYIASTKIATAVTKLFNKATKANVIGLIVTALTALVAGLTYFFTQTETGQAIWGKFTDALGAGWDWVSEKLSAGFEWISEKWNVLTEAFQYGWETYLKPVWDGLVTAGQYAAAILGTVVLAPIMIAWNLLSEAFMAGWENYIKPAWDAMASGATWLYENAILPAVTWISDKWTWLSLKIQEGVYHIQNLWALLQFKLQEFWANHVSPIITWISDKWSWLSFKIQEGVYHIQNLWALLQFKIQELWASYVEPILNSISEKWHWMKDKLGEGWAWIRDNVFSKFEGTINTVKSAFDVAVDGISKAWSSLKALLAEPVNFIIREVYMGGIREAWGKVADLVDLPPLPEVNEIGGFAEGTARVPGARTRHDNVHMVSTDGRFGISLRGDEGVLVPEAVDGLGEGAVNALNHAGLHGGKRAVDRVLQAMHLGGFDRGGFIDLGKFNMGGVTNLAGSLSAIQRSHAQFVGRFFPDLFNLTSASRNEPGSMHDFGSQSATDWQAKDGQYATQMPTPGSKALARAIYTNFPNTTQLIHHPLDGWQNLLNGGPFDYGPGTNSGHGNHVHWGTRSPLQFDGDDIVLSDIPGGGIWESITGMAKRLWDGIIDKVPGFEGAGKVAALPGAFLKKAASAAWDFIKSKADSMMSFFSGGSGGNAEQWRGLASQALKRMGYGDEYLDAMVQQIQIESTGDPNSINLWDSNAAKGTPSKGLLQVIDPTYRDVRRRYPSAFEGLPDDMTHPLTNLVAGVGAVTRDWGGPGGRWPTKDGYHAGGLAGWGQGLLKKTAIEPEMVLDPEMTKAFVKWMDVGHEIGRAIGPDVGNAARGYFESQASSVLDVVGLGGLVPMASGLAEKHGPSMVGSARSMLSGVSAGVAPGGITVVIEAESDEDLVRVGQLKQLSDRVHGLDVQVNTKQRPPAGMITRGGAM